jgi:hypothetical protein
MLCVIHGELRSYGSARYPIMLFTTRSVGWVEALGADTHPRREFLTVGIASLHPPYAPLSELRGLRTTMLKSFRGSRKSSLYES